MIKKVLVLCVVVVIIFAGICNAQFVTDLESGLNLSGYNDVRIPGDTGTPFSLADIGSNASLFFRAKFNYTIAERHTISILLAPFTKTYQGKLSTNIADFAGQSYSSIYEVNAKYQFNSWRLSYRWDFIKSKHFQIGIGLTGKIRDAKISMKGKDNMGTIVESSKKNVGFVPLINFLFAWKITPCMDLRIEGDALAAPQGRAEDIFFGWTGCISDKVRIKLGYRFLEGGADNNAVYNFALFHYIVFGLSFQI